MPRGSLEGARALKAAAGGEETQNPYIFDAHWITFGAFLVPLMPKRVPFWAPLDFEGCQIRTILYKIKTKNEKHTTKTISRKKQFLKDFRYQNKRHKKLENMFSHYTCCILRDFAGSRNSMKNEHPNVTTNLLKLTHWAPFEEIVEIGSWFWKTLNLMFCITLSIDPKIDKTLQKKTKMKRKRCQGRRMYAAGPCRSTRGTFTRP